MRDNKSAIPRMFDPASPRCYHFSAGWSSLVARWAHNPKVGGSNPPPATKKSSLSVSSSAHTVSQRRTPVGDVRRVLFLSSATPNSAGQS